MVSAASSLAVACRSNRPGREVGPADLKPEAYAIAHPRYLT